MSRPVWTIWDAFLAAAARVGAQAVASVVPTPNYSISRARKVDVVTIVGHIHLPYVVVHASTEDTTLCSLFIVELA